MRRAFTVVMSLFGILAFTAIAYAAGDTSANTNQQQTQATQQSMVGGSQAVITNGSTVFPNPGANASSYPGLAGGYWSPLVMPSGNAQKANSLIHLQDVIPSFVAQELAKQPGGKVTTHLVSFVVPMDGNSPKAPVIQPASFQVIASQPSNNVQLASFDRMYQLVGINFIRGDDQASSFKILGTAISDGLKIGADAMTYVEGASLEMVASSWGIGISNSLSVVGFPGGSTGLGNVAAGGLGYTKAHATYIEKPWMSVEYFKKRTGVTGFYSPSSEHPIVPAVGTLEMYPGPPVLQVSAPANSPAPQPPVQANNVAPVETKTVSANQTNTEASQLHSSLPDPSDSFMKPHKVDTKKDRQREIIMLPASAVKVDRIGWYH